MSDQENTENTETETGPDELTLLKDRATLMGITFHPNIGLEKLKTKIEEKLNPPVPGDSDEEEPGDEEETSYEGDGAIDEIETIIDAQKSDVGSRIKPLSTPTPNQQKMIRRKKATRLVRVRVTNMNPIKGNLKGEILSVGNSELGMIKKFIPYNAEQGYHIPQILLTHLQGKKFMTHYDVKENGKKVTRHKLIPEYAIEIMSPLTSKELQELKQRQIMAAGGSN